MSYTEIQNTFLANQISLSKTNRQGNNTMQSLSKSGLEVLKKWDIIESEKIIQMNSTLDVKNDQETKPHKFKLDVNRSFLSQRNLNIKNDTELDQHRSNTDLFKITHNDDSLDSFVMQLSGIRPIRHIPKNKAVMVKRKPSIDCFEDSIKEADPLPKRSNLILKSMQHIGSNEKRRKQVKFDSNVQIKSMVNGFITESSMKADPGENKTQVQQVDNDINYFMTPPKKRGTLINCQQ